jgi:hypothetical protein
MLGKCHDGGSTEMTIVVAPFLRAVHLGGCVEAVGMSQFPCLIRTATAGGDARYALGDPLVDPYLACV